MTLIANHAAINARVIGANEHESHYIFDLLMSNTSDIIPDVLSTDTHGVNHVNFALLDLFGYQFAPRYAQVGKVINDMFDVKEDKEHRIQLCLKKPINTHRIAQHWDTIQRIAVSLKQRKTTQATLVRKLSEYKRNHPLLEALTEYNRLVKANYLLCAASMGISSGAVQTKKSSYGMSALAWSPMPSFTSTPGYSASC